MALPQFMQTFDEYGEFIIMNLAIVEDGYGGHTEAYTPGAHFMGVLMLDSSIQAQVAEAQGVKGLYTLTYDKTLRLPWHTVFCKANNTSEMFRVTSKDEKSTPKSSSLDIRQVNAEEWTPGGADNG